MAIVAVKLLRGFLAGLGSFTLFDYLLLIADRGMAWRKRIITAGILGGLLTFGMLLEDLGA